MAGKHYTQEEIDLIVSMKNDGKSFEDIKAAIKEKFSFDRPVRAIKIVYDRKQNKTEAPAESKPE
jgi:hypothetical protein